MNVLSNEAWVESEFGNCDFGDQRLNRRVMKIARSMIENPGGSINAQNLSWPETKAAYRFFQNAKTDFQKVTAPHMCKTLAECDGKRVLLIGDITEINYTLHHATEGLGMLGDGKGRGFQLYSCLALDTESEEIVGLASAQINYRVRVPEGETRTQRLARWKESDLWGASIKDIGAPKKNTEYVFVFDRGGDIFDVYGMAQMQNCDWVIRAGQLKRKVVFNDQVLTLDKALKKANEICDYTLDLRARPDQKARVANLTVSSMSVEFLAPQLKSPWLKQAGIESIKQNIVIVEEKKPGRKQTPIKWVLLTSLPVTTEQQCWDLIEYYEKRWFIEEYHKAIKTGCAAEESQLRTAARLETEVGMIAVLAIRILSLKQIAKNDETAKAKKHIPEIWIAALLCFRPTLKKDAPNMSVRRFIHELAKLGGFNGRNHDGEPGWQSIWAGIERLTWVAKGMGKDLWRCG